MSDIPSVPSAEHTIAEETLVAWTNSNVVLQKLLQSLDAEDRSKIVLRCDDLPLIAGDEECLEDLFRGLLQMILQKKDAVPTLFLHISCTADDKKLLHKDGWNSFTIQFNTNIIPCTNWFESNKSQLDKLQVIVAQLNGRLVMNEFRSSGCIFSLSLPGKAV